MYLDMLNYIDLHMNSNYHILRILLWLHKVFLYSFPSIEYKFYYHQINKMLNHIQGKLNVQCQIYYNSLESLLYNDLHIFYLDKQCIYHPLHIFAFLFDLNKFSHIRVHTSLHIDLTLYNLYNH